MLIESIESTNRTQTTKVNVTKVTKATLSWANPSRSAQSGDLVVVNNLLLFISNGTAYNLTSKNTIGRANRELYDTLHATIDGFCYRLSYDMQGNLQYDRVVMQYEKVYKPLKVSDYITVIDNDGDEHEAIVVHANVSSVCLALPDSDRLYVVNLVNEQSAVRVQTACDSFNIKSSLKSGV